MPYITYDREDETITVDYYPRDLVLICTAVVLEDTPAILVEGDYLTPDSWSGGMTIEEKAEAYYDKFPERFEEVEP